MRIAAAIFKFVGWFVC